MTLPGKAALERKGELLCLRATLGKQEVDIRITLLSVLESISGLFPEYQLQWEKAEQRPRPTLSVAMIVKNEEKFLAQCLDSIKEIANEIVVVDTGSTDKTVEIAWRYTSQVYSHPWEDSFSKARNQSLSYCTGDWILQIDADEELTPDSIRVIREDFPRIASDPAVGAISVSILNESKTGGISRNFYPRLFCREGSHFEGIVHNQIKWRGKKLPLPSVKILHHGYNLSPEEMERKRKRSEALLEKQIEADPENWFAWRCLIHSRRNDHDWAYVIANAGRVLDTPGVDKANVQTVSLDLAIALQMTKQYEQSIAVSLKTLSSYPENADIVWHLSGTYGLNGQRKEAIKQMKRFLAIREEEKLRGPTVTGVACDSYSLESRGRAFLAKWEAELEGKKAPPPTQRPSARSIKILSHCEMERGLAARKQWADYWIKRELEQQFTSLGLQVVEESPDITLHLFGIPLRKLPENTRNIVWVYSHPDLVTPANLRGYDKIFTKSEAHASKLRAMGYENVSVLVGATGHTLVECEEMFMERDIAFVGNARRNGRKIISDIGDTPYNLKVWGRGWEKLLLAKYRGGRYFPNEKLNTLYASSRISVCDHHADMAREAFISVRLLDILASGGFAISDQNAAIEGIFGDTVPQYRDPEHLRELLEHYINDPDARRELAERGRKIALRYTWNKAARQLLGMRPRVLYVDTLNTPQAASNVAGTDKAYRNAATVRAFDYRALAQKHGQDAMNQMLVSAAEKFRPDLIHLGKCELVKGSAIKAIKEKLDTTVVHFYGDYRSAPQPWVVDIGKYADLTLFNSKDERVRGMYREAGVRNPSGFWFVGADPDVFYPRDVEKTYDVAFMGSNLQVRNPGYPKRRELLRAMLGAGLDVHIFGNGWDYLKPLYLNVHLHPFVNGDVLAEAYSRSKVTLGINGINTIKMYASWRRAFCSMASGAFHLTHYVPGLETVFENGKHLVWFKSEAEALELVQYYLSHEDERGRIAAAGRKEVLANHTWDVRIAAMLEHIAPRKPRPETKKETPLKLHLGCGSVRLEGYVNIDVEDRAGVCDLTADVSELPMFETESVEHIFNHALLEHLPPWDTMKALREWHRVLKPGGTIQIEVPDLERVFQEWLIDKTLHEEGALACIYGGNKSPARSSCEQHHLTGFTYDRLTRMMAQCGFERFRRHEHPKFHLNLVVRAQKGAL